jgi:hypothetical protein
LKQKTRSILEELDSLPIYRDKESLVESRAINIIRSAINLIGLFKENYSPDVAADLERRLINSIKGQDPAKFSRGIRRVKHNGDEIESDS